MHNLTIAAGAKVNIKWHFSFVNFLKPLETMFTSNSVWSHVSLCESKLIIPYHPH